MKKIAYVMIAAAAVFASACSKVDTQVPVAEPQDQASRFIFDVTVDGPDTRAVKTAWEEGDQFLIFFENDLTLGHQLRLTYNGSGWTGRFDDEQFAETFTAGSKGLVYGIHYPGTITATQGDGELRMRASGTVIMSRSVDYSVSESDGRLKFSANLTTYLETKIQLVVTGDGVNVDDSWTLKSYYRRYDDRVIGCTFISLADAYFDGHRIGNYSLYQVSGVPNADGVAFNFRYDYDGMGDIVFALTNSTTGKTYYRIVPEGALPTDNEIVTGKAYKMALSSFVEQTDNTGLVRDAAYHYYNTVKLKDGKTWMADNYRYVPEGMSVSAKDFSTNTGIWYPAALTINGTAATAAADDSIDGIRTKGLLYSVEIAMGAKLPTTEGADAENLRGICPEGWHVPTLAEWAHLVGACSNAAYQDLTAPYYDAGTKGAPMQALDEDGFNCIPSAAVNGGTKYMNTFNNKAGNPYYQLPSMAYFASSTGRSATQSYAAMITNNATFQRVTVGYNNLPNGISVRCVKD